MSGTPVLSNESDGRVDNVRAPDSPVCWIYLKKYDFRARRSAAPRRPQLRGAWRIHAPDAYLGCRERLTHYYEVHFICTRGQNAIFWCVLAHICSERFERHGAVDLARSFPRFAAFPGGSLIYLARSVRTAGRFNRSVRV